MRRSILAALALLAACKARPEGALSAGSRVTAEEARAFFDHYVVAAQQFDPRVADFYDDGAVIHTLRHGEGEDRHFQLGGAEMKAMIPKLMPLAKQRGDRDRFSDIAVSEHTGGAKITATRYAQLKCTRDTQYFVEVARDERGQLRIVEEFQQSWQEAQCGVGEGKSLEQRQQELVEQIRELLPLTIDAQTRLDSVGQQAGELTYRYTLTAPELANLDPLKVGGAVRAQNVQQACYQQPALYAILRAKGRISFVYLDATGAPLFEHTLGAADCDAPPPAVTGATPAPGT